MPSALYISTVHVVYHYSCFCVYALDFHVNANVMIAVGSPDSSFVNCCCRTCLLGRLGLK